MKLIDTSVWIDFFRTKGSVAAQHMVKVSLGASSAAYAGPVETELLAGARDQREIDAIRMTLDTAERVLFPEEAWADAGKAKQHLARKGFQVSLGDILIAAIARSHKISIVTRDSDFETIRDGIWHDLKVELIP